MLTRAERKKAVRQGAKAPVNLLKSRLPGGRVLPCIMEVYEKSSVRSHVGEEFVYVLSGEVVITIGRKRHRLSTGESITFFSAEPHTYQPADPSKGPVTLLVARVGA